MYLFFKPLKIKFYMDIKNLILNITANAIFTVLINFSYITADLKK